MEKTKAVYLSDATCHGAGRDRYKWVSGITKKQRESLPHGLSVLVPSNTDYRDQHMKLAVYRHGYGWQHRQINDADFEVVRTLSYGECY